MTYIFLWSIINFLPFHKTGRLSAHSVKGSQEVKSKDKAALSVQQKGTAVTTEKLVQNTSIMNKSLNEERKSMGSRTSATVSNVNSRYVMGNKLDQCANMWGACNG
jgi:hypothetical protein